MQRVDLTNRNGLLDVCDTQGILNRSCFPLTAAQWLGSSSVAWQPRGLRQVCFTRIRLLAKQIPLRCLSFYLADSLKSLNYHVGFLSIIFR